MDNANVKQLNDFISVELAEMSKMCILADMAHIGIELMYDDKDLFNAFYVFMHTWQNRAIQDKTFTMENIDEKIGVLTDAIEECFGIDVTELAKTTSEDMETNFKEMN